MPLNVFAKKSSSSGAANSLTMAAYLGDGSDGTVVLDGTNTYAFATLSGSKYTLSRDVFAQTIVINNGITLETAVWRVNAKVSITNNGIIQCIDLATAASGAAAGTWPAVTGRFIGAGRSGGAGGTTTGSAGAGGSPTRGGAGGTGGAIPSGAAAGIAGTGSAPTANIDLVSPFNRPDLAVQGGTSLSGSAWSGGCGGSGGGGVDSTHKGGGGGYSGGMILLSAPTIVNNGQVNVPGSAGAASPSASNGGGGGGGGGGWIMFNTTTPVTGTGTTNVTAGAGGAGAGTGAAGSAGTNGTVTYNVWAA